jgi:hypothetical protein
MYLTLRGIFSRVDNYQRMCFTFHGGICDDGKKDDTQWRLQRQFTTLHYTNLPFANGEFFVHPPKGALKDDGELPEDFQKLISRQVEVVVKAMPYKFISKLKGNLGEEVKGVKFTLDNIRPIKLADSS